MTEARIGAGSRFWLANASGTLTKLDELTAIPDMSQVDDEIEATSFDSEGFKEYINGLTDSGTGDFVFNLVPGSATDTLIAEAKAAKEARDFRVVIPDGAFGFSFTGQVIVRGYSRGIPINDRMTGTMTVRFSGKITEEQLSAEIPD